ncbi:uncharacterized protein [Blastocystis hominis]|uniref:UDP-N-acetylglucosamine diphosphorylase n=1 Tax=Blastocystis hominis TaxID=12968 RepID=D8M1N6_BLAHO|nr:uncharacterized protein [Blastocystis hominis]CBK21975.2 unnamed protein product [Blastocystis hominis]|eukprot:XP_012896023.1 uncharacterized protein [Blastocystis hominis]
MYIQHHYFGLAPSQVIFFSQGTLPCIDNDGHVILSTPFEIATAPDGNGGLFMALHRSHTTIAGVESEASVIAHMQQHGVRFVQIYGVDNAIVRVPDPVMFGLFMQEGDDAGNKCVAKNGPHERVGVVCKKGGKYNVVEYSELSEEMATQTDAEGNLVLSAGFICNLYYTVDFLVTKCSPETLPLLYHVARKAIPYYDEAEKTTVKPKEPNGVKMESFIFDVFPMSEKMGCLLVPRSEFTPVKNGNDAKFDCPDSARKIMEDTFAQWLQARHCQLQGTLDSHALEVSGLVSFAGENLERLEGQTLVMPCVICRKSEVSEKELEEAATVCEGVVMVKGEVNKYVFL